MTPSPAPTLDRLIARTGSLRLTVDQRILASLASYFDLLQRWNEKINLTSLGDGDEAIDRLIMEPLVAARFLPRGGPLLDVGSGGGSPAIPLAISLDCSLTMVESRGRKAAFLREALRTLNLNGRVETDRAEALVAVPELRKAARIVSLRAVRMTSQLSNALVDLLADDGFIAMFSKHSEAVPERFKAAGAHSLVPATQSFLHCFVPIR